jgi:hypothetical protein
MCLWQWSEAVKSYRTFFKAIRCSLVIPSIIIKYFSKHYTVEINFDGNRQSMIPTVYFSRNECAINNVISVLLLSLCCSSKQRNYCQIIGNIRFFVSFLSLTTIFLIHDTKPEAWFDNYFLILMNRVVCPEAQARGLIALSCKCRYINLSLPSSQLLWWSLSASNPITMIWDMPTPSLPWHAIKEESDSAEEMNAAEQEIQRWRQTNVFEDWEVIRQNPLAIHWMICGLLCPSILLVVPCTKGKNSRNAECTLGED